MTNSLEAVVRCYTVAVLERDVSVAVSEISRTGCLLESSALLAAGTVATLSVEIDGTVYTEHVRVARCQTLPGAGERHHVGVEFLTVRRPAKQSLRMYAASLNAGAGWT